ncbi:MAG: hypothetical protein M0005_01925 [Actinomycetota bacterium]|nr:hypothetical protein [Actinomycetota bacterium]
MKASWPPLGPPAKGAEAAGGTGGAGPAGGTGATEPAVVPGGAEPAGAAGLPAVGRPTPAGAGELARTRRLAYALGPPALALASCLLCYAAGWRGTDWAAQIYRAGQASRFGLVVWDPGWYGGTLPLNYSLVFPLAADYLGLWPVAALSAAGSAACFDRLVTIGFGRRPAGSWYFALTTLIEVAIGQLPTLVGEALALGSVLALYGAGGAHRRRLRQAGGLALGVLAGLTSPVAGSFLALVLVALGLAGAARRPLAGAARRPQGQSDAKARRPPADGAAAKRRPLAESAAMLGAGTLALAASAVLPLAFPGPGYFPFSFSEAAVVVLIAAAFAVAPVASEVRTAGVLYGVVTVVLFAVHTQMGDNDARLAAYIGVPLALCYLPRWTKRAGRGQGQRVVALMLAGATAVSLVVWDWSPIAEAFGGATDGASSVASYYTPLVQRLDRLSGGRPVRVEVPPLAHHWESAYLAARFPLARGWERQLDMAYNPIFYRTGPIPADAYRSWLLANGVSYVALARAPLDYASKAEAALLGSGRVPGLELVWRSRTWELWKVVGSRGLASGPAEVSLLRPDEVALSFSTGGTSVVKVRWASFWSLPSASRHRTCLRRAPGGWTQVYSATPGTLRLTVSLFGANHGICRGQGAGGA